MANYSCTRCDKPLRGDEIAKCKCSNCDLEFKITKATPVELFQEDQLIDLFAERIFGKQKKIDYYSTAINICKAMLTNVVCHRNETVCSFYLLDDGEIVCFLFMLKKRLAEVRLEMDIPFRYEGVVLYDLDSIKSRKIPCGLRSYYRTKNFEKMMEMVAAVYERKNKKHRVGKIQTDRRFFYDKK